MILVAAFALLVTVYVLCALDYDRVTRKDQAAVFQSIHRARLMRSYRGTLPTKALSRIEPVGHLLPLVAASVDLAETNPWGEPLVSAAVEDHDYDYW